MKGIALSTIALFIIALVSIILLITFVGVNMSPAIKKGYCDMIRGFTGLLPLPEHMKTPLPAFCIETTTYQKVVTIEAEDPNEIAYEIAAHSLACWKITGEINVGQDTNCFELVLKRISGEVTKDKVISNLPSGYKNIIDWQAGSITTEKSIGIYYNATSKLIVVV
jgi:hypothetical protein